MKLDPPLPLLNDDVNFWKPGRIESENVREFTPMVGPPGAYEKTFLGFDEQVEAIIGVGSTPGGAPLKVDLLADGMGGSAGPGVLPAGGKVTSHYLFFDPKNDNGTAIAKFEITFDWPIVGVIYSTLNVFDSDYLGL
ncbi:MAG: hypothetical protein IIA67_05165, partial [Planctomycetes bacterium]|nr:hypothetical protein [Planctomycetota bacterium]